MALLLANVVNNRKVFSNSAQVGLAVINISLSCALTLAQYQFDSILLRIPSGNL